MSQNPHRWTAALLVVLLALTAIATIYTADVQRDDRRHRGEREAAVTLDAIDRRVDAYGDVLVSLRGLLRVDPQPSRAQFREYLRSLQIASRYPGLETITLARGRAGRLLVTRSEPSGATAPALGSDLLGDVARRGAVEATRRTGAPAATRPLLLAAGSGRRAGFELVLAVPGGGVVTATVRTADLVDDALGRGRDFGIELYDAGPAGAAYRAAPSPSTRLYGDAGLRAPASGGSPDAVSRELPVAGRRWLANYTPSAAAANVVVGPNQWIVAICGLLGSLLAAWLFLTLARGRSLALELAGRMTHELERSERQTREILETAPDAFVALDEDGAIRDWNPQAQATFGWLRSEVLGARLTETLLAERDRPLVEQILAAPEHDSGRLLEVRALHRDGHELHIELSIATLPPDAWHRFNVFLRDISERVQAQRKFEQFVEFAPDAIVGVGEDGAIVLANAQVERMFGYAREELLGQRIEILIPDRFRVPHAGHRGGFFQDPGTRSMGAGLTLFARRKDGTEFPAEISLSSLETAEGPLATAAVRDITERTRMQHELATKERQTRQILETAHDAFIAMDEAGVITDWNPQAEATFGWSRDEAVGRSLGETIVPPAGRVAHRKGIERFLQTGEPRVLGKLIELDAVHRDGHEFPVELTISPLRTERGWLFHAFVRDITERTRTQEQLALAHAQAVEASQLKSDFLANMSHEIRTPLNGVIGLSGLLLGTELDDEQRDYAEAIRESGDALMAVISDILDFSKIEAGKLELDDHPFELHEVVDGVSAMLAMEAHEKGLDLMVWVDDDVPSAIRGDAARIRQVLANLATNAIKFTHEGEVVVRTTVEPGGGDERIVRFAVTDTGIGIPSAAADRIFDAFSQADTSTTREYGGTGLGLAISKQLVELMGGRIGLESTPGTGSTFWFTVPVTVAHETGDATVVRRSNFAEMRVLVVDDNATSRTILQHQLTSWGMRADTTAERDEALALLLGAARDGRPYALALLDFNMPECSGLDIARAVQAERELRGVRLMVLSSSSAEREAAIQAGVQGFVTKPVRASRLGHEIARVLGAGQLVPAVDPASAPARLAVADGRPVLVAEDKSVNQLVAVRLLEKLGFRADIASNGREAVEMHARGTYEAIFMDCQMPELDGYQATAEIRRRESGGRHTPIIAMTAHTLRGDRERCLAAGMDDYIGKPIRTADLADVVTRALARADESRAHRAGDNGEAPLMDAARLADVFGDDEESRSSLLAQFLAQARATIADLGQAIEDGDSEAIARLAHGLKGSSAVVGAERLSRVAAELSEGGAANRLDDAAALHDELTAVFELTDRELAPITSEESR